MILTPLAQRAAVILAVIAALCLAMAVLTMCVRRGDSQRHAAEVGKQTGRSLDKVAVEIPAIRNDQKERENEVANIEGSDAKLPDGFADSLQRVRDRK